MKDVSVVTHKLAETIRDMITLGEINKDCTVTICKANFKDSQPFISVSIYQYPDFSEGNLIVINNVIIDAFKDTGYSVRVGMTTPKTIKISVVEEEK